MTKPGGPKTYGSGSKTLPGGPSRVGGLGQWRVGVVSTAPAVIPTLSQRRARRAGHSRRARPEESRCGEHSSCSNPYLVPEAGQEGGAQ
jgi:hypothetical protein